jgi:integrase
VLIMTNSGMRKGEARNLKWPDVNVYRDEHGEWVTLTVTFKTGERLVVCQSDTHRYFNRLRQRGYRTDPDDWPASGADGA